MTEVISAFPGTGKTHFYRNTDLKVLDSDSSDFSWLSKGVRNPDFPNNYIRYIKDNMGHAKIILVSSHPEVRRALVEERIDFRLVYPERELRDEYVERFRQRDSGQRFVQLLSENWNAWISEMETQRGCVHSVLKSGEYLGDLFS